MRSLFSGAAWSMLVLFIVLLFPVVSEARCGGGRQHRLRNLVHRIIHPFHRR